MPEKLLIGIDLGTSSLKGEIFDTDGNIVFSNTSTINKQDHKIWEQALVESFKGSKDITRGKEKIAAIDSTSGTILLVDSYGNPLLPPIMYYEKDEKWYEKIKDLESVKAIREKGVNINPSSPIVKILRIKNEMPNIFNKVRWIVPAATWLAYRLVIPEGKVWDDVSTDYTNALKLGADITGEKPVWFKPLFEEVGIPLDILPSITKCGEYIGEVDSKLGEQAGLSKTSIYHGMTDGNAAALASGALEYGELSLYAGTTTVIKYVSSKMISDKAIYYHKHPIKGYLAGTATGVTGGFLSWFSKVLLNMSVEETIKLAENIGFDINIPLFFPPGDRSPFYEPSSAASMIGLTLSNDREESIGRLTLSIILGITLTESFLIDMFEEKFHKEIKYVNLSGGGSKNKYWNRIRASIYDREIYVYGEKITIGTLIPTIINTGIERNIKNIRKKYLRIIDHVYPDNEISEKTRKYKEIYSKTWTRLIHIYKDLKLY